jgi:hypothetical protein
MSGGVAASFDVSVVCSSLEGDLGGLRPAEIHSLCYLARLLALVDEWPEGSWGYDFASTKAGAPFSPRLDEAITLMVAAGSLAGVGETVTLSSRGRDVLERTRHLPSLARRLRCLEPACSVTLTMPLPSVTDALTHEPQLRAALSLQQTRPLLDETGLGVLRPHIDGIRMVLADIQASAADLLVPATVWIAYLHRTRGDWEAVGAG